MALIKKRSEQQSIVLKYWAKKQNRIWVIVCSASQQEHPDETYNTNGRFLASYSCYPLAGTSSEYGGTIDESSSTSWDAKDTSHEWLRYSFQSPTSFKQWVTENIDKIESTCLLWDAE